MRLDLGHDDSTAVGLLAGLLLLEKLRRQLPGLRRRGYSVLIDEDGTATERFPSAEGKGTLIELVRLRIKRIRHFSSADELRTALSAPNSD